MSFGAMMVSVSADISALAAQMKNAQGMVAAASAAMAAASGAIAAGLGSAVSTAADFEKEMSKVKALTGEGAEAMARMKAVAIDLGGSSVFSASEVAKGMSTIGAAGLNATEVIAAMPGVLDAAAAAGEDFGKVSDIMISVRGQFQLAAGDMGRIGNVLAGASNASKAGIVQLGESLKYSGATAKTFGTSLEATAAMLAILSNSGVEASQAGTTLNEIMSRMTSDNKQVAQALHNTKTAITDTHGSLLPFEQIIGQLNKGMAGMTDAQRLHTAGQIAGSAHTAGFLALLQAGSAGIQDYTAKVSVSGQALAQAKAQTDNLRGSIEQMKGAWETAKIAIGDALIPAVRGVVDALTAAISAFNALPGPIKTATSYALAAVAGLTGLTAVVGVATLAWGPFKVILGAGATALGEVAAAVGGPVIALGALATAMTYGIATSEGLRSALSALADSDAVTAMGVQFRGLGAAAYESMTGVLGAVGSVFRGLADAAAPGIASLGQSMASGLGDAAGVAAAGLRALNTLVPQMLGGVREAFAGISLYVRTTWSAMWSDLRALSATFGAWLSAWITAAGASLSAGARGATASVTATFGGAWVWVKNATAALVSSVSSFMGAGMASAVSNASGAMTWITNAFGQAYRWLSDATSRIVSAVASKFTWLSEMVGGLLTGMGAVAKAWGAEVVGTVNLEIARGKAAAAGAIRQKGVDKYNAAGMGPSILPGYVPKSPRSPGKPPDLPGHKGAGSGGSQTDEIAEAWKRLKVSLATVDAEASVLGSTYDKLGGQHQALEGGIKAIVGAYVAKGKAIPTGALAQYTKQLADVQAAEEASKRTSEEMKRAQQAIGNAYAELAGKLRAADVELAMSAGTLEDQQQRLDAVAGAYRGLLKDFNLGKVDFVIPFDPAFLDHLKEMDRQATQNKQSFKVLTQQVEAFDDFASKMGVAGALGTDLENLAERAKIASEYARKLGSDLEASAEDKAAAAASAHALGQEYVTLALQQQQVTATTQIQQQAMRALSDGGLKVVSAALDGLGLASDRAISRSLSFVGTLKGLQESMSATEAASDAMYRAIAGGDKGKIDAAIGAFSAAQQKSNEALMQAGIEGASQTARMMTERISVIEGGAERAREAAKKFSESIDKISESASTGKIGNSEATRMKAAAYEAEIEALRASAKKLQAVKDEADRGWLGMGGFLQSNAFVAAEAQLNEVNALLPVMEQNLAGVYQEMVRLEGVGSPALTSAAEAANAALAASLEKSRAERAGPFLEKGRVDTLRTSLPASMDDVEVDGAVLAAVEAQNTYRAAIDQTSKQVAVFGASQELANERVNAAKKQLQELAAQGFLPTSRAIENAKAQLAEWTTAAALAGKANAFADIERQAKAMFGVAEATPELLKQKASAATQAMQALVAAGVDPASAAVVQLREEAARLNGELTRTEAAARKSGGGLADVAKMFEADAATLGAAGVIKDRFGDLQSQIADVFNEQSGTWRVARSNNISGAILDDIRRAEEAAKAFQSRAAAFAQPFTQALSSSIQAGLNAATWDFSSFEQNLMLGLRGAVVNAFSEAFSASLIMPKLQPLLTQIVSAMENIDSASGANRKARMDVVSDLVGALGTEAKALMATYQPLIDGTRKALDSAFGLPGQPGGGAPVGSSSGGSSSGSSGASGSLFPFRVNGGLPEAQTNRPATQITLNYTGSNPQDGREMARIILGELQGMGALG